MSEGTQYTGGIVNGRCYARKALEDEPPLYYNGNFHFQAYQVGWIVAGTFALISTIASIWLVNKHLQWYTNPSEQRYIVRLLFMVPIYALISFGSYLFWNHSTPLILIRDCYESVVLTSFFYLLLTYLSPNPDEQKEIFRVNGLSHENDRQRKRKGLKPQKWVFPLGSIKSRPADGLYFLQIMKWAVLQYCIVRPATTLAAVILDYAGLYCEVSLTPGWGHLYIIVTVSLSVSITMYCLVQLYVVVSEQLKPHQPLLKLFSLKAVVFLTFWQATGLSLLVTFGLIKDTEYMTAENISIGIGAIIECLEMTIFAFLHIKCFTYKVYVPSGIEGNLNDHRTPRLKSLGHAMNPMETLRELWAGIIYMVQRWRGKETDKQARRMAAHQGVFGHTRSRVLSDGFTQSESLIPGGREKNVEKAGPSPFSGFESGRLGEVLVDVEREVYMDFERQWLGVGNAHDYVLGAVAREKSEGFEDQVVRELYKRGYTLREASKHNKGRSVSRDMDIGQGHVRGGSNRRSWWQTIYQRVSQSGEDEQETHLSPHPKRKSASRPKESAQVLPLVREMPIGGAGHPYEDPPPPSTLHAYNPNRFTQNERKIPHNAPRRTPPPASNFVHQSPGSVKPTANPQVQLNRSDSLLNRVFTYLESDAHVTNTDLDHGTESQPSRPISLWGVGSANVIPKHNEERSSLTQANVSDGIHPQLVTPVRGDVVRVDVISVQDEELDPTPKRSHIREMANHSESPSHSPLLQPSSLIFGNSPFWDDPLANALQPLQSSGVPQPSADYDRSFPPPPPRMDLGSKRHTPEKVEPVYPRQTHSFQVSDPPLSSSQQYSIAGPSSPPNLARPRPATRNKALLRPFPEPVHQSPANVGPTRSTPPRSKLTTPTPLAQPLPRGSGSLKRNKMHSLPPPEQSNFVGGELYLEPQNRSRRHSQPIPTPNHMPHPSNPSRNAHRRTSQSFPAPHEASHPNMGMSPPSSPQHRPSRRPSSPLSALRRDKPSRSNAIYRKPQPPGSRSPTQATSRRTSLLAELRGASPMDTTDFTRYPVPGPGSGIGSPPKNSRTRVPPSPRTPTFVNTHMLLLSTNGS